MAINARYFETCVFSCIIRERIIWRDVEIEFFNGYPLKDLEQMKSNKEKED